MMTNKSFMNKNKYLVINMLFKLYTFYLTFITDYAINIFQLKIMCLCLR